MAVADIPNVPPQYAPVMIAQASQAQQVAANMDRTIGICQMISNPSGSSTSNQNYIEPVAAVRGYFKGYEHKALNEGATNVTVLIPPAHGKLEEFGTLAYDQYGNVTRDTHEMKYRYLAETGYVGQDSITLLVAKEGYKVQVKYFFHVLGEVIYDDIPLIQELCPNGTYWRISTTPDAGNLAQDGTVQSWLAATNFSSLLSPTSGVSWNFADLPGGALGQTTGTNITLDDNAAGNNWFIDSTPADNSEFLPTSNPYEWVAKEGSAAYGKMDMLSVLLHEYGHALGIEHSADSHNYMATTLTAGVRRLPSAEELALMQNLIAGVKATLSPSPLPGGGEGQNGPSQLPLLPLGGFGLAFLGRLRSSRYGSINLEADLSTLVTQYAVTANAKLTNGNFSVASGMPVDNGWATQGSVDFAGGAATLKETSTRQTRLNQVFVVNPRDRFLSFTEWLGTERPSP